MKLVFLVYDSRSGSTLLSREIATYFSGVFVTPEIRFDPLLGRGPRWWQETSPEKVRDLLSQGRVPEKLELSSSDTIRVATHAQCARAVIEGVVAASSQREGGGPPDQAVIKSGRHLRVWREIIDEIPDARFLYVVRDPRAVIASKLTTERPYHPGETMAWAGTFVAAMQWSWYGRLARRLSGRAPLHVVAYEALLARHGPCIEALSEFFGTPASAGSARYPVPAAERAIHERVLTEGLEVARTDAWRSELAHRDQAIIEVVCGREMRRWGYAPELRIGPLRAIGVIAGAAIASALLLIRGLSTRLLARRPTIPGE